MAFGAPSRAQALCYLTVALAALAGFVVLESIWMRVLAGLLCAYAIMCLFITNAWTALLPRSKNRFRDSVYQSESDRDGENGDEARTDTPK